MAPPENFGIEIEQFAGRSDGKNEGRQRVLSMIKVFDKVESGNFGKSTMEKDQLNVDKDVGDISRKLIVESSVDNVFLGKGDDVEVSVPSDISQSFDMSSRKLSDVSQDIDVDMVCMKLSGISDNVEDGEVQAPFDADRVWASPDLMTVQQGGNSNTVIDHVVEVRSSSDLRIDAEVFVPQSDTTNPLIDYSEVVSSDMLIHVLEAREIFDKVIATDQYNFKKAKVRVPSGLNISAWKEYLQDYGDRQIIDFLQYGWPVSFNRTSPLIATDDPHPSGREHPESVKFYIQTEALLGPFEGRPVNHLHTSPIMTRPKKDSDKRRIVLDLSWPDGFAVNDGIDSDSYLDVEYKVRLPKIDLMEQEVLKLGRGAFLYKTDLSRGYRQLRVDPYDWPLLGFKYDGKYFMDICPPFGLRSAAMMMQRTSQAVVYIHKLKGYSTFPYIDDFGGAEQSYTRANSALEVLQKILKDVGLVEALNKVCKPAQEMVWLGILFNTTDMTMSIPDQKLEEIMLSLREWDKRTHATRKEIQSIVGSLQFVAKVSPPVRLFISRMLDCLRDTPRRGSHTLSLGFKKDIEFFLRLLPQINGVKIIDKSLLVSKEHIELDACLTGCGAWCSTEYYSREFPDDVLQRAHTIAHLELINLMVAVKLWAKWWSGHRVTIRSDNMNTCIVVMKGRSQDDFMQACAREIYVVVAAHDIDLDVVHTPGVELVLADALSREHKDNKLKNIVNNSEQLKKAVRVYPHDELFRISNDI